jgi:hypothetical protein
MPVTTDVGRAPFLVRGPLDAGQGEILVEIQVNTGSDLGRTAAFIEGVVTVMRAALGRFDHRVTRIEVHLTDENGSVERGNRDTRCMMEARPAGLAPIAVIHCADSPEKALIGAAETMERTLRRTLGNREGRR